MNRRTLFLLAGAAAVGLLYFGDQAYRTYIEKPSVKREKKIASIEKSIKNATNLIDEQPGLQTQLDNYQRMSLPFDPATSRMLYQDWLLALVKSHGLANVSIDAGTPIAVQIERQNAKRNQSPRKTVLYRYGYGLRFRGSLQQLVKFLFDFYRSGNLHKIRALSLNPSADGNLIDVSLSIEAMSLNRTDREQQLSTVQVDRLQDRELEDYLPIAQRNIFSREGSQSLKNLKLTGITFGRLGKPQVWLQTDPGSPAKIFGNDDRLNIDAHSVEIVDIQSSVVLMVVDGKPVTVGLGETLHDAMEPLAPSISDAVENSADSAMKATTSNRDPDNSDQDYP